MIGDFKDYPVRHFQPFDFGRNQNPTTLPRRRGGPKPPTTTPHAASTDEEWLADAPARSASILERLAAPAPEPPTPPSSTSGFDLVTTTAQLRDALNTYASER